MPAQFFNTAPTQPAFAEEVCIRAFEPVFPYPQNPLAIVYRARFMQLRAYYTRPAVNTPHPNLPQVYFADDTDFQDRLNGMIEWTRIYLTLPPTWSDYESYPYAYPGYYATSNVPGRPPMVRTTTARLLQEYALVGTLPNFSDLLTNYDDFNNADWSKTGGTTTPNATNIPACAGGTNTAALFVENNSGGSHYVGQASNGNYAVMSAGVLVKAAGRTVVKAVIDAGTGLSANDLTVDLQTGIVLRNNTSNYSVSAMGDGWWRISITTPSSGPSSPQLSVVACDSNGNSSYTGDGRGAFYAWRGQLVSGSIIPHATVPPSGSAIGNANYPLATPGDIPGTIANIFTYGVVITGPSLGQSLGFLSDVIVSNTNVNQVSASIPSLTNYKAQATADAANANSYSLEATDATIGLYQGSIWTRQRRQVKSR